MMRAIPRVAPLSATATILRFGFVFAAALLAFSSAANAQDPSIVLTPHNRNSTPLWSVPFDRGLTAHVIKRFPSGPMDPVSIEAGYPALAPPPTPPSLQQQIIVPRVPKTHIGFYNISVSKLAIVLMVPTLGGPIVLESREMVTIDCSSCSDNVDAIVPKDQSNYKDEFRNSLKRGSLYIPTYDYARKQWLLSLWTH